MNNLTSAGAPGWGAGAASARPEPASPGRLRAILRIDGRDWICRPLPTRNAECGTRNEGAEHLARAWTLRAWGARSAHDDEPTALRVGECHDPDLGCADPAHLGQVCSCAEFADHEARLPCRHLRALTALGLLRKWERGTRNGERDWEPDDRVVLGPAAFTSDFRVPTSELPTDLQLLTDDDPDPEAACYQPVNAPAAAAGLLFDLAGAGLGPYGPANAKGGRS